MMSLPIIFNPMYWFSLCLPKVSKKMEEKKPEWEMNFKEVYETKITSSKKDRKEAEEECFKLFNIHSVKPTRTVFDADIKKIKQKGI